MYKNYNSRLAKVPGWYQEYVLFPYLFNLFTAYIFKKLDRKKMHVILKPEDDISITWAMSMTLFWWLKMQMKSSFKLLQVLLIKIKALRRKKGIKIRHRKTKLMTDTSRFRINNLDTELVDSFAFVMECSLDFQEKGSAFQRSKNHCLNQGSSIPGSQTGTGL